ncbi:hypothetical protein CVT25_015457 [Psilocybe cyanescens]|uniref:Uncharacterized protein n=1 Tax=Psilocybe cyanescens TaxID=93625 RepID=A0A409X1I4_PSICY|nr:hypothetical protein CVT25_015457 [Psilocybe cyanescens]
MGTLYPPTKFPVNVTHIFSVAQSLLISRPTTNLCCGSACPCPNHFYELLMFLSSKVLTMTWTISPNEKSTQNLSHLVFISHTVQQPLHSFSCSGVTPPGFEPAQRVLVSSSALGVGGVVIPSVTAMWLPLNARTALVLTSWRSITPLHLVARVVQRQTPQWLQCPPECHALISLIALTVERITVPMSVLACSGVTDLILSGLLRNIVRYKQILSCTNIP